MLQKRVKREFEVLNKWTNKSQPFRWSGYALDKIYPSIKKSIPLELRKALKQFTLSYAFWKEYMPDVSWLFETTSQRIKDKFSNFLYLPWDFPCRELPLCDIDFHMNEIYEAERIINKYIDRDFSDVKLKDRNRQYLLSNIPLDCCEIDLVQKVSRIKRNIKRLEKLEKL